jgi:hypothetical protein
MLIFRISFKIAFKALRIKRVEISSTLTSKNTTLYNYNRSFPTTLFIRANMAPSKRNRSATLVKSLPQLPIRPIRKRPRQKTPESFFLAITPSLPLRPTKPTTTFTPIAFNSSQVDESDSEEENTLAQVISESESERESENKEEDNIICVNKYLDQDLNKELGPDRLDKEDTDESDAENEVSEEFKISKFFG